MIIKGKEYIYAHIHTYVYTHARAHAFFIVLSTLASKKVKLNIFYYVSNKPGDMALWF